SALSHRIQSTASITQLFHRYKQAHPAAVGKNIMPYFMYLDAHGMQSGQRGRGRDSVARHRTAVHKKAAG
ncbi:MAG: hypothetical protein WCK77_01300, partial [Verrucomicrobiota bacterium]